jgi:hypothetical protein
MAPAHCTAHSEYVILIVRPVQQWLRDHASMVHLYLHCLSCCKASTPRIKSRLSVIFLGITFHKNVPTVLLFSSKTVLTEHNFENTVYQCFRTRVPQNTGRDFARKKWNKYTCKKKSKYLEKFQIPLKTSREFLPNNLQYQNSLHALPTASLFSSP